MPEIDLSKLGNPEELLKKAEEEEEKGLELAQEELPDEENEKISEEGLDKLEEDDDTERLDIEDNKKVSNETEEKAKSRGWKPKNEFKGDPKDWIDAEEFNRQSPLHDTIAELSTRSKKTEKALNSLLKLFSKQEKDITTGQLEEAKLLREDAIRTKADPKLVDKFDVIIAEKTAALSNPSLSYEEDLPKVELPHEKIHPLAKAFVEKNLDWWYADDADSKAKVAYASVREQQLVTQLGDRTPKIYKILEAEMEKRFGKPAKNDVQDSKKVVSRAPPAEGITRSSSGTSRGKSVGRSDLDADDRDTFDTIKRRGGDTKVFLQALLKAGRINNKG